MVLLCRSIFLVEEKIESFNEKEAIRVRNSKSFCFKFNNFDSVYCLTLFYFLEILYLEVSDFFLSKYPNSSHLDSFINEIRRT